MEYFYPCVLTILANNIEHLFWMWVVIGLIVIFFLFFFKEKKRSAFNVILKNVKLNAFTLAFRKKGCAAMIVHMKAEMQTS